jgi:hypothetical protein
MGLSKSEDKSAIRGAEVTQLLTLQLGYRDYDDHMASKQREQEEARPYAIEGPEEQQTTGEGMKI